MSSWIDDAWNAAVGGVDWLKQVVFGEFDENRSTSAMIADMLASFIPGVIIVTSARDLTAVLIRLVKHPERREDLEQWMLVFGCAIPLALPLIGAAAGAVIGGIAGSEAGAALRAVALMLIEHGGEMLEKLLLFLRKFIKGDVLAVLKDIKFVSYGKAAARYVFDFLGGLAKLVRRVIVQIEQHPSLRWLVDAQAVLKRLREMEEAFYGLQRSAIQKLPLALAELDARLAKALGEESKALEHPAHTGIPAPKPVPVPPKPARVPAMRENRLGVPEGTTRPGHVSPAGEQTNLHPQKAELGVAEMEERALPCFKGSKLPANMTGEMDRQLAGQQQGLNNMTVQEYLDGRAAYSTSGRGNPSVARNARTNYQTDLTDELRSQYLDRGFTSAEATQRANTDASQTLSTLAALHNPDQVAGGANQITDFGDRTVNSTIGGQWASNVAEEGQSRVQLLDAAAQQVPAAARSTTKMNVKLEQCK